MSAVRPGSCLATVIAKNAGGSDPTIVIATDAEGSDPTTVIARGAEGSDPTTVIARAAAQRRPVAIQAPAPIPGLPRPLRGLATTDRWQNHSDPVVSSRARNTCERPEQVRRWRKAHYNH